MPYSVWGRTSIISMGVLDSTRLSNSCRMISGLILKVQKRPDFCGYTMPTGSSVHSLDNPVRRDASTELDIIRVANRGEAMAWVTACTAGRFLWAKLNTPERRRAKGRVQE